MKKRLIVLIVMIFALTAALTLSSCDLGKDDPIDLSGKNIRIVFLVQTYEYNGLPHYPGFQIVDGNDVLEEYSYGEHNDDIIVTYDANMYVGTATVTVTAVNGGKYTGRAIGNFQIVQQTKKANAGDFQTLKKYLDGGGYAGVVLIADVTVPEGQNLTVEKGVVVDTGGYALVNNGNLENKGEIASDEYGKGNGLFNDGTFTNKGKILLYAPAEGGEAFVNNGDLLNTGEIYFNGIEGNRLVARNYGKFNNSGSLALNKYSDFYNHGTFSNGGRVTNSSESKFFTYNDVTGNEINYISRMYPIGEFTVTLQYDEVAYDGTEKKPSVTLVRDGVQADRGDYEVFYENNVNVGTATVRIVATEDSDSVYGETTLTFEIKNGSATVSDREEFYSAIANANYDMVTVVIRNEYGTFFDKGFTVPEGVTLNVSSRGNEGLRGNVVNNGKIVVDNDKGLVVYGTLENSGEITSNNIDNRGSVVNDGVVSLGGGRSYTGDFVNNGSLMVAEGGILYVGGNGVDGKEFENYGDVTTAATVYVKDSLTNNADFVSSGDLFVFSTGSVTATALIDNGGNVYVNAASDAFADSGNVVVRTQAQDSDLVLNKADDLVYDGKYKSPGLVVADGNADDYYTDYFKNGTEVFLPKEAGEYTVTVTFEETSRRFYGSASATFTIKRAAAEATTVNEISELFKDPNYDTVNYSASFNDHIRDDFEVPAGYTLTTAAGSNLIVEASFTVTGALISGGTIFFNTDTANLTVADGGSFVNNGTCYFNGTASDAVRNDGGEVIVREDIATATVLVLEKTEVMYGMENGYITTEKPGFTLTDDGVEVNKEEYEAIYSNYDSISDEENKARLLIRAKATSSGYYGEKAWQYTVLPGETAVATFEELKEALGNIKAGTELCNFGRITVTADIDVEGNRTEQTLVIPSNVTLVLGDHALDLRPEGTFDENVFLENYGVVEMTSYNIDCVTISGDGKFVGYAADADVLSSFARLCDEVYLTADINGTVSLYSSASASGTCVIDLCGYDVRRIEVKMQGVRNYTLKSSVAGSTIGGEGYADSGIYCEEIDEKAMLTLVNITVYGIEYNYLASEEDVTVDASCVVIG